MCDGCGGLIEQSIICEEFLTVLHTQSFVQVQFAIKHKLPQSCILVFLSDHPHKYGPSQFLLAKSGGGGTSTQVLTYLYLCRHSPGRVEPASSLELNRSALIAVAHVFSWLPFRLCHIRGGVGRSRSLISSASGRLAA